jgi:hypothetical protein
MTAFEIPVVVTERLRLRAFHAGDLDANAAMQAQPGGHALRDHRSRRDPRSGLAG